ncbi:N-6 DNA methylase [Paenibacillus barcinonensis]|uniref:site-specific DNA-methyltransferase (adenine-specific) n=2 Tax=Paenibacillus barcinonensis TaxID=198119 RepID=A0A2V4VID0_PAEBA|nr:N-6 DNA methylase [Paenibacillus barcinonensis]PYE48778.1 adenine-specific DNA-methyltransferase [Paenibacillus barcinonensis]QKS57794.1 N-6 DNA methylase [Paenibacillus barcinonensis]
MTTKKDGDLMPLRNEISHVITKPSWDTYKSQALNNKRKHVETNKEYEMLFSPSFCFLVLKALWRIIDSKKQFELRSCKYKRMQLDLESNKLAKEIAGFLSTLSIIECSYYIGVLYTYLLPQKYKAEYGIYYTPPVIAERLLDLLGSEGVNWSKDSILDPACGGGAFLVPVANRILGDHRIKCIPAEERIRHLENHLSGIEIDEFAGWLTQVMLDVVTYQDACLIGRKMKNVVRHDDTIKYALKQNKSYQLIVGNPPYGRVTLNEELREAYSRSLYGHANMYGLFIDAALRMKSAEGFIGFVTPTSFMGGQYFSNLRNLLMQEAPPLDIDFITERSGVFDEVLQETCLTVFGPNDSKETSIHNIKTDTVGYRVNRVGTFQINEGTSPWFLPRDSSETKLIKKLNKMKTTLKDYGYKVSTGPLVWNRHKEQLDNVPQVGSFPIIWSHSIINGNFTFDYKNKKPKFINIQDEQDFLVCKQPVVLLQRTTSKEQQRRLISTVLPQDFLSEWDGAVIENHVNMIHSVDKQLLSPEALSLILSTTIVDRIFRCISGSVAVSASELHALPLPPLKKVLSIEDFIQQHNSNQISDEDLSRCVEQIVLKAYNLGG